MTAKQKPPLPPLARRRDLWSEAGASVAATPLRSLLTSAGTAIGIAAFVAVLGVTSSASARISSRFDALRATEVQVVDNDPAADGTIPFPEDTQQRLETLNGVRAAGTFWTVAVAAPVSRLAQQQPEHLGLIAAAPGALDAAQISIAPGGRVYDELLDQRGYRVALLGKAAATRLGVTRLDPRFAIFIGGTPFSVIGIIDDVKTQPELLLSVVIPAGSAIQTWNGRAEEPARVLIRTDPGAARLIAEQAPYALRPDIPDRFDVRALSDPTSLRKRVESDVTGLFLLLAGVCLLIGTVAIANSTIVSLVERIPEIGLRRALGARRRDIAGQFLAETLALGTLGGTIGMATGLLLIVLVTATRGWTTVVDPRLLLLGPLLGTATGLLAGIYPSIKATRIEPTTALRR